MRLRCCLTLLTEVAWAAVGSLFSSGTNLPLSSSTYGYVLTNRDEDAVFNCQELFVATLYTLIIQLMFAFFCVLCSCVLVCAGLVNVCACACVCAVRVNGSMRAGVCVYAHVRFCDVFLCLRVFLCVSACVFVCL